MPPEVFNWDDIEEDDVNAMDLSASDADINDCVQLVSNYFLSQFNGSYYSMMGREFTFSTDIDPSIHKLLSSRFSDDFSLDSRISIFEEIQRRFHEEFNKEDRRSALEKKMQEHVRPIYSKFTLKDVNLCDNPIIVGTSKFSITVEILVSVDIE